MLHVAICDDNHADLRAIHDLVHHYFSLHPELETELTVFPSPAELVQRIETGYLPDLCLLDILMPELDGIRAGRALRAAGGMGVLLYLTSSTGHALDAYGVRAFRYLLKPVPRAVFFSALDDAIELLHREYAALLSVRCGDTLRTIRFRNISYVECLRHVHGFHLLDGSTVFSNNSRTPFLHNMAPLLRDKRFFSPHRSFVVNLTQISRLSTGGALMYDGSTVPVPRTRYTETKQAYLAFLSSQNTTSGLAVHTL